MKHGRSYLYGGLGILVLWWLLLGLSRRTSSQFANSPAPAEERRNPVADKIVAVTAAKNVSPPTVMRAEMMRNAGNSTALAALETELYALRRGDPALVASVITFEPADAPKIVDLLSTVPLGIRKQYPTPERLVAFLFMGGQRMESVEILAETPPRDDIVVQHLRFKFIDDPTIHEENMVFSRDSGGWKSVVPLGLVERLTDAMSSAPSN